MNKQEAIWEDGQEAGVAAGLAKKTLVGSEVRGNGPGRSPEAVRFGFSRPPGGGGLMERMIYSDFNLSHIGYMQRIHQKVGEDGRGPVRKLK